MIINQNKIITLSQNIQSHRYSYKRQSQLMMITQSLHSKIRFFTQRQSQKKFNDYQKGKRIINDLPEIKLVKNKNKPTLYNNIFNFISNDRHKNQSKIKKKYLDDLSDDFADLGPCYQSKSPQPQRSIYTQFLKRKNSEYIEGHERGRGYSLLIPALQGNADDKIENVRIFKRKSFKNKYQKTPKLKNKKMMTEPINNQPKISQLMKIQRKQINGARINKSVMNKTKLFNIYRKDEGFSRFNSSRIQPWTDLHNQNDTDVF